jgi:CHASE3 domain sensor protein
MSEGTPDRSLESFHDTLARMESNVRNLHLLAADQAVQKEQITSLRNGLEEIKSLFSSGDPSSLSTRIIRTEDALRSMGGSLGVIKRITDLENSSVTKKEWKESQEKITQRFWIFLSPLLAALLISLFSNIYTKNEKLSDEDLVKIIKTVVQETRDSQKSTPGT